MTDLEGVLHEIELSNLNPEDKKRVAYEMTEYAQKYAIQKSAFYELCLANGIATDHQSINQFRFWFCAGWDYIEKKMEKNQNRDLKPK